MKIIERNLPFTDKTEWAWPDEDEKLVHVFEHVSDIDYFLPFLDGTDCVIQAGGACGVWPYRYAQLFSEVHTFEPMAPNRECLTKNLSEVENVTLYSCALSNKAESGSMAFDRSEHKNYGAVYFKPGDGDVTTTTIDEWPIDPDLIQLDIEGHELEALQGAVETIGRCSPVIVLEEKPLPQQPRDYMAARKWLAENFGYKQVGAIHKDVVFKRL